MLLACQLECISFVAAEEARCSPEIQLAVRLQPIRSRLVVIPKEMLDFDVEALYVITVESGLVQAIVALPGRSLGRLSEIR